MAEIKTKPGEGSAKDLIKKIEEVQKRKDSEKLLEIMLKTTGEKAVIWGGSMIGFGVFKYKTKSGQQGDWFRVGFSPRAKNLVVYLVPGMDITSSLLSELGKFKTGKSCLYLNKLSDVKIDILEKMIKEAYQAKIPIEVL
jgi:hypothetical protein